MNGSVLALVVDGDTDLPGVGVVSFGVVFSFAGDVPLPGVVVVVVVVGVVVVVVVVGVVVVVVDVFSV